MLPSRRRREDARAERDHSEPGQNDPVLPPLLGADTAEVLRQRLALDDATLVQLAARGVIGLRTA